jgi:hypothetical protein
MTQERREGHTGIGALPRLLAIVGLALILLAAVPRAVAAETGNVVLIPATARAFVELTALNVNVAVICTDQDCGLEIEQVYHLQNRDRLKAAEIQVAVEGGDDAPAEVTFAPAAQTEALADGTWRLRLGPEEAIVATVRYGPTAEGRHFLQWQWDGARLGAWGHLTSARVEVRLPWDAPSDLILEQEPSADGFDGRTLHWEYEEPTGIGPFRVWLLAPVAWREGETLRRSGDAVALARYYRELGRAAAQVGAPYADSYPLALGALLAATKENPSPAPHLALAGLYQERAEELPELAMNYRLLAAQEMEAALAAGATDEGLAHQLAQLYFGLAQQAHASDNAEDALRYIGLAHEHAAEADVGDALTIEAMLLDWALDLASKGRVSEALLEAAEALSPRVQDALYRYAPTIVAAHTEITLTTTSRTAIYRLHLYPPLAAETASRLQELATALNELPAVQATLQAQPEGSAPSAVLSLEATYASLAELESLAQEIDLVGAAEGDLAQALIAAPWHNALSAFGVSHTPWWDQYSYQERPGFAALEALRQEQAQYTIWRLVEASSGQPEVERDRLEAQLTALALREQRDIWENLSSSSYWSYHVAFAEPSALPTMSWLVGWGQERELEIAHRHFWWRRIAEQIAMAGGALLLVGGLIAVGRRLRRGRQRRQAAGGRAD